MSKRIIVVNPNSTERVTRGISEALAPMRMEGGPLIECLTLAEGPPGIQTQADVERVVQPLCRLFKERSDADAYIIACFSDPGLYAARELTRKPVLGIAECGILTALSLGERFGIIAILNSSISRHLRYVRSMGLGGRFAADIAIGLEVVELIDEERVIARMTEVGAILRDRHGADVVVMGCAGMAQYRERLQAALGIAVVEPTQAALAMALGRVQFAW